MQLRVRRVSFGKRVGRVVGNFGRSRNDDDSSAENFVRNLKIVTRSFRSNDVHTYIAARTWRLKL